MLFPKSWCSSNWTQAWSKNRTYFRMWYNVKLLSKYLCSLLGLSRAFLRESCAFFIVSSFMSLFISGMNLSVIVFPPASPCPSSLRTDLSSFSWTQWETLLPESFQHQPFSPLQGKEVTPGASPVASWVPRSPSGLRNSNQVCGGHVRWLCSPEVALLRWKENWKVGDGAGRVPWTYPRTRPSRGTGEGVPRQTDTGEGVWWHSQERQTLCAFAEQTPAGLWGYKELGVLYNAWSSFNTENVEIWGWLSNARTHLLLSPLSFSSLTHTLPGHILQMLHPSKRTKFISSWYFAFNSQLLLSMLRGHTSLSLSSARDFCNFLGKPLRIWPAGEIRG